MKKTLPRIKRIKRITRIWGGLFVLLVVAGLFNHDFVHCSAIDPTHPLAASNYFIARGFPTAWLVADKGAYGDLYGPSSRVLKKRFLGSAAFSAVTAVLVVSLLRWISPMAPKSVKR